MGHGYRPIICKIEVLNPNSKATVIKNRNLLKYIATREGVDLTNVNLFEESFLRDLSLNAKQDDDFMAHSSDEEYLKYISFRPRSHGLFGNIDTERFNDVSKQLNIASAAKKPIYRCMVSLSELDGKALGYNCASKWQLYLNSVIPDIATTLGMSPTDMTWVAAFHAEEKHPHVHFMMWDNRDKVSKAFVTPRQHQLCREICQNAMFTDENEKIIREITAAERNEIYSIQNASRNEIIKFFSQLFNTPDNLYSPEESLPERMTSIEHSKLIGLYKNIFKTMPGTGRIMYKFMPPECKAYIDQVTELLLKRPDIKKEYTQYLNATNEIHHLLGKTNAEIHQQIDISKNELYTRTGNIILKGICGMKAEILNYSDNPNDFNETPNEFDEAPNSISETSISDDFNNDDVFESENNISEADDLQNISPKSLKELVDIKSESFNPLEAEATLLKIMSQDSDATLHFILGKLYATKNFVTYNPEKAIYHLEKFSETFTNHFEANALLGKIYSDKTYKHFDYKKAEAYYMKALHIKPKKSNFIKLRLSRLYMERDQVLFDYDKALSILSDASDYVGSVSLQTGNIYMSMQDEEKALQNYKISSEAKNTYGAFQCGKILINPESKFFSVNEGIKHLEVASKDIPRANLLLGNLYMKDLDYQNAENYFLLALKQLEQKVKNKFACLSDDDNYLKSTLYLQLGKMYANKDSILFQQSKADQCYKNSLEALDCIKDDPSGWLSLQKSKLYLENDSPLYNLQDGVIHLKKSAEQGNSNAAYRLGKILLDPDYSEYSLDLGLKYLQQSAEHNFNPAIIKLGMLHSTIDSSLYNPEMAMKYFQAALSNGYEDKIGYVLLRMGTILLDPDYSGYSLDLGLKYLQQSAEHNFNPAIIKLGMLHSTINSSLYNPEMAMKYFHTALSNDYEDKNGYVLLRMGTIYADTNYSSYDMNRAMALIEQAAHCNNAYAMVKLAKCYLYGIGINENRELANEWLNRAAQLDNEIAKDILQKLERDAERQTFLQFRSYSYAILRQVFLDMQQLKAKNQLHLHELHFKTISKQVKKEEYLHKN